MHNLQIPPLYKSPTHSISEAELHQLRSLPPITRALDASPPSKRKNTYVFKNIPRTKYECNFVLLQVPLNEFTCWIFGAIFLLLLLLFGDYSSNLGNGKLEWMTMEIVTRYLFSCTLIDYNVSQLELNGFWILWKGFENIYDLNVWFD